MLNSSSAGLVGVTIKYVVEGGLQSAFGPAREARNCSHTANAHFIYDAGAFAERVANPRRRQFSTERLLT